MAHSLPHNLKNLCHSQITTAHQHLSIYVHIVFMKFLCTLQRFVLFVICLKPDTKRCKPHGTPSTWPLEDQEFYMSFSLADSHSYPGNHILTKRSSQWHTRNIPALNNTAQWHWDIQGTAWQRDFYEIRTRSLRDLYEIGILRGKAAGIFSTLPFSALRLSNHLYSSISSIRFSSRLYSSTALFCVSQAIEKPSHEFLSQKEYVSNTFKNMRAPAKC